MKRARSSASNALEYEDEIRKVAKKEGIEDVDGLIDELYEVADISELSKVAGRGRKLGQKLSKADFEEIKKFLKSNNVDLEIHPLNEVRKIEGFFTV